MFNCLHVSSAGNWQSVVGVLQRGWCGSFGGNYCSNWVSKSLISSSYSVNRFETHYGNCIKVTTRFFLLNAPSLTRFAWRERENNIRNWLWSWRDWTTSSPSTKKTTDKYREEQTDSWSSWILSKGFSQKVFVSLSFLHLNWCSLKIYVLLLGVPIVYHVAASSRPLERYELTMENLTLTFFGLVSVVRSAFLSLRIFYGGWRKLTRCWRKLSVANPGLHGYIIHHSW